MKKNLWSRWRANFVTGLAIVLPAVMSIAIVRWPEFSPRANLLLAKSVPIQTPQSAI